MTTKFNLNNEIMENKSSKSLIKSVKELKFDTSKVNIFCKTDKYEENSKKFQYKKNSHLKFLNNVKI